SRRERVAPAAARGTAFRAGRCSLRGVGTTAVGILEPRQHPGTPLREETLLRFAGTFEARVVEEPPALLVRPFRPGAFCREPQEAQRVLLERQEAFLLASHVHVHRKPAALARELTPAAPGEIHDRC